MTRRLIRAGVVVLDAGRPAVQFESGCAGQGCSGCGTGAPKRIPAALLALDGRARPGDRVQLTLPAAALTRVAVICFALPLAALLAGAGLGAIVSRMAGVDGDLASGLMGLAGLALGLAAVGRSGRRLVRTLELNARLDRTPCS